MAIRSSQLDASRVVTGPGIQMTLLATSTVTGGAWSLFKYEADSGFQGPAPHWHEKAVERFYILDGAVQFEIDGDSQRVTTDEFISCKPERSPRPPSARIGQLRF